MDNIIAVAYISRRGEIVSPVLSKLARNLWLYGTQREIYSFKYIIYQGQWTPLELRAHPDRSDWKLAPTIFQKIHHLLGPLSIDLFASCLSAQLPLYVSWKLDPLAMGTDAFSMDWFSLPGKIYANPPWGLIGRVLSRVHSQNVWEMVLVAPVWKAQAWYPLLLQMLVKEPLIIPQSQEMIQSVCQNRISDIIPQLAMHVHVDYIRGRCERAATFQS